MHTILVCGVVLATTYSVWNGFTLTVRSWVRPEQVRAARATSSLGLFLVTAAAVTWFFGWMPLGVSIVAWVAGAGCVDHAGRVEVRLIRAQELAAAVATVGVSPVQEMSPHQERAVSG